MSIEVKIKLNSYEEKKRQLVNEAIAAKKSIIVMRGGSDNDTPIVFNSEREFQEFKNDTKNKNMKREIEDSI